MDSGVHGENSSSRNDKPWIKRIETRGTSGEYASVLLSDGSSFFVFTTSHLFESGIIREGAELSAEEIESIRFESRYLEAKLKAYSLMETADQSAFRLKQKLLKRGFSESVTRKTVEALIDEGLVDDERYARAWVSARLRRKPEGPVKLIASLRSRGIHRDTAEKVVDDILRDFNLSDMAAEAAESLKSRSKMTDEKLIRALLSRGFPYPLVRRIVKKNMEDYENNC